ncbi:MAG: hypothetical protein QXE50_06055 [Nitrososphaerota archaeon]
MAHFGIRFIAYHGCQKFSDVARISAPTIGILINRWDAMRPRIVAKCMMSRKPIIVKMYYQWVCDGRARSKVIVQKTIHDAREILDYVPKKIKLLWGWTR